MSWLTAAVVGALLCQSEPKAPTIYETKFKYEPALKLLDGVLDISVGGIDGKMVLIVRVNSEKSRDAVRLLSGNGLEGHQVYIQITSSKPKKDDQPAAIQAPKSEKKKVEPDPVASDKIEIPDDRGSNFWKASVVDCDIIRSYHKLKDVTRKNSVGMIVHPCKMVLRQQVGAGGGHSYVYTKHRSECPVRLGRVAQPAWADNYIAWVFQVGFGPAMRGSFLWPYELRASDKLWVKQVREDLMTRLQYIREGAQWTRTPDDRPGVGWKWEAPFTTPGLTPTPTPTDGGK
jgi:hypothetical protein